MLLIRLQGMMLINLLRLECNCYIYCDEICHHNIAVKTVYNFYSADVGPVYELLVRAHLAAKWPTIATNLRLGHLIVAIESNYKDAEWCLRHAIAQWLRLNYLYKKYGHPSWRILAKAIRQLDGELVEKIAQEHPAG